MIGLNQIPSAAFRAQINHFPNRANRGETRQDFSHKFSNRSEAIIGHVSTSHRHPQGDDIEVQGGPKFLSDLPKYL